LKRIILAALVAAPLLAACGGPDVQWIDLEDGTEVRCVVSGSNGVAECDWSTKRPKDNR
jgi:hypothetical protein